MGKKERLVVLTKVRWLVEEEMQRNWENIVNMT